MRRVEHNHEKLLLEVKNPQLYPGIERQILKVLGNDGWLDHRHLASRLIVQSFSADSVRTVHELKPGVRTAFLGRPAMADLHRYAGFVDLINVLRHALRQLRLDRARLPGTARQPAEGLHLDGGRRHPCPYGRR